MSAVRLFHCFAVPRSGTTFFARLMNSHRQIVCGAERYLAGDLEPRLLTREALLTERPERLSQEFRALVERKDFERVRAIGDKQPRAYFSLTEFPQRFPQLSLFVLLRDLADIGASWNARAEIAERAGVESVDGWHRGQVSLFAFIEFVILVKTLLAHPPPHPVTFISYRALFDPQRQDGVVAAILERLGCTMSAEVARFLAEERERSAHSNRRPRLPDPAVAALGEQTFFRRSNTAIAAFETWDMDAFRRTFAPLVADFERNESGGFADAIRDCGLLQRPAVADYAGLTRQDYRGAAAKTPLPAVETYLATLAAAPAAPVA